MEPSMVGRPVLAKSRRNDGVLRGGKFIDDRYTPRLELAQPAYHGSRVGDFLKRNHRRICLSLCFATGLVLSSVYGITVLDLTVWLTHR